MTRQTQIIRNKIKRYIENYFEESGFISVETPSMAKGIIPESHIDNFVTYLESPYREAEPLFLLPSPELYLKQLTARGWGSVYEFAKSYRNKESISHHHSPEFTMLEWYRDKANYLDNIQTTNEIIYTLGQEYKAPWANNEPEVLNMRDIFKQYTQVDLDLKPDRELLNKACIQFDLTTGDTWEESFHSLFLSLVEDNIPKDRMVYIKDYPIQIPTLAKPLAHKPYYERWELYINGIEIGNCYTEEYNKELLEDYYEKETKSKLSRDERIRIDSDFINKISNEQHANSGVAVGFDRLIMVLLDIEKIQGVINFPLSDIIL
ncbi:amino acid--tRNA ligase-related protein [Spirochaeta cellobiosiphila]|uniref:amino acid--tRNA ligase-related protein n=1 Tax=Spirochaeta cellobiosiphila TaxID=504483 RepID=UPI000421378C|nr:amino acid--tRNA ligase-related protein [Spirochaeta cellobiosiphila]